MALQYDSVSSSADFQAALTATTLSAATQDAITAILGDSETVAVGSFDGTTLTAPSGVDVDVVFADIAGNAGEQVPLALPADAMASASAWVFNSEADLTIGFTNVERVIASGNGNDTVIVAGDQNIVLDGGAGNDSLSTSGGNDSVIGGAGDDSISTAAGDDTIVAGEGNDTIDAGTGFDIVQIEGASSSFDFSVLGGSLVATALDGSASVTASNVEVFSFGGLDKDNVVITANDTAANAMRLYEGLLARSADVSGAQYWLDKVGQGASLEEIAGSFLASEELQSYGELSNEEYVLALYENALDRTAEDAGRDYWVSQIENGASREQVAISIVGSPEGADAIDSVIVITGLV
ncbi:DUF4214 domain-containing protein [Stutzerimonas stutzeri]|uniref:DUF4214 domain-containing protein n=1 Tax=Stutzerimonas stutzeri TaxID=316 RepID=UPI00210E8CBF|nr:DUF4214 domain-containing protein [Stutzerimonas stutzeri]MCQ4321752.1 DUF4214 domain-containing protein [Stutzerimonas stutzeri]